MKNGISVQQTGDKYDGGCDKKGHDGNSGWLGKWKSRIICVLSACEKLRYIEIRREMYNITDAVLAATLKDLTEDGIVDRKSYDEIPPKVEYSLTKKGKWNGPMSEMWLSQVRI